MKMNIGGIEQTLLDAGCQCIRTEKFDDKTEIQMWQKNGKAFLVLRYRDEHGWDVYIPACEKNDTQATLDALDNYLKGGTT